MPPWETTADGLIIQQDSSLENLSIGSIQIVSKVRIGQGSYIGNHSMLGYPCDPVAKDCERKETKIGKSALIRPYSLIYENVTIGANFRTGAFVQIREGNRIGDDVSFGTHSVLERDSVIGNRSRIHSNCFICECTTIEEDVWIGPCVTITNDKYPVTKTLRGPRICQGAIVGANSMILPSIVIGRNAVVAAGSFVTRDVPDETVVMGIPARKYLTLKEYALKREQWKQSTKST